MAYSFIKNKKGGVGVLLDSAADISLVPVDQFFPGTFAFTADGSARYRLSTSRSWVEVTGSGVTPGGGWPEDLPLPSEGGYGYTDEDETVHKINSKYLPESGGAMAVEFVVDEDMNVTSNKTVDEILDAESSGTNIIGVLYEDGADVPFAEHMILTTVMRGDENKLGFVCFNTSVNGETLAITFRPSYAVYYDGTKWVAGVHRGD